jgi:hypothetical protein
MHTDLRMIKTIFMKNLLYIFLLLLPCTLQAQITQFGSFKILESEVMYQKVFTQDSVTVDKMVEFLKTVPTISNIQAGDGVVTADLVYLKVDYKKFKAAQIDVPAIIQTGIFNGKLIFDIKSGKYRATLRGIQMKGDTGTKKITEPEFITKYSTTDNGTAISKDWAKPTLLGLLEQQITERITYKEVNTDWK